MPDARAASSSSRRVQYAQPKRCSSIGASARRRQLAQPVGNERLDLDRRRAVRVRHDAPPSMHARSRASARWRMTRTLPAESPSSVATSSLGLSAKNVRTTTERSRSASASQAPGEPVRVERQRLGRVDRLGSVAVGLEQRLAAPGAAPDLQHHHAAHARARTRRSAPGSRSLPARSRSSVMRSTCCMRSCAACRSRRWRRP